MTRAWLRRRDRGNALVEFGLIMTVMVPIMGTAADYGMALWTRSQLSSAVSHAAKYAYVVGPTITSATLQTAVTKASNIPTAPTTSVTGPAWYCTTGTPVTTTTSTQGATCASGQASGQYVTINATSTYVPLFPFYSVYASTTIVESAIVRLQ